MFKESTSRNQFGDEYYMRKAEKEMIDYFSYNIPKMCIALEAPSGARKTKICGNVIKTVVSECDNDGLISTVLDFNHNLTVVEQHLSCWDDCNISSPRESLDEYLDNTSQSIKSRIVVSNWAKIVGEKKLANKKTDRTDSLLEKLPYTINDGLLTLIIDEPWIGVGSNYETKIKNLITDIIQKSGAKYVRVLLIGALMKESVAFFQDELKFNSVKYVKINRSDVIESGFIKKSIKLVDSRDSEKKELTPTENWKLTLDLALEDFAMGRKLKMELIGCDEKMIVFAPDGDDHFVIEKYLTKAGQRVFNNNNNTTSMTLADAKDSEEYDVLLFKLAGAVGYDPNTVRVGVILRSMIDLDFTSQCINRMTRMDINLHNFIRDTCGGWQEFLNYEDGKYSILADASVYISSHDVSGRKIKANQMRLIQHEYDKYNHENNPYTEYNKKHNPNLKLEYESVEYKISSKFNYTEFTTEVKIIDEKIPVGIIILQKILKSISFVEIFKDRTYIGIANSEKTISTKYNRHDKIDINSMKSELCNKFADFSFHKYIKYIKLYCEQNGYKDITAEQIYLIMYEIRSRFYYELCKEFSSPKSNKLIFQSTIRIDKTLTTKKSSKSPYGIYTINVSTSPEEEAARQFLCEMTNVKWVVDQTTLGQIKDGKSVYQILSIRFNGEEQVHTYARPDFIVIRQDNAFIPLEYKGNDRLTNKDTLEKIKSGVVVFVKSNNGYCIAAVINDEVVLTSLSVTDYIKDFKKSA